MISQKPQALLNSTLLLPEIHPDQDSIMKEIEHVNSSWRLRRLTTKSTTVDPLYATEYHCHAKPLYLQVAFARKTAMAVVPLSYYLEQPLVMNYSIKIKAIQSLRNVHYDVVSH
jgi:hypothetical protein